MQRRVKAMGAPCFMSFSQPREKDELCWFLNLNFSFSEVSQLPDGPVQTEMCEVDHQSDLVKDDPAHCGRGGLDNL